MLNIRNIIYTLSACAAILFLASCVKEKVSREDISGAVELEGIQSSLTKAAVAELTDYVGKSEFEDKDSAVFSVIKRTANAIEHFTYNNIKFVCDVTTTSGKTSIGWRRVKEQGGTDRIYWSDATNPHTFIGYCAPQQGQGAKAFDWNSREQGENLVVFYGSLGDPTVSNDTIDFYTNGNIDLCKNDILLTHSTTVVATDAIAKLRFFHGLAQVRVIVSISDFAAGGGDDTKSVVSNMVLKDMLTMYKWKQLGVATEKCVEVDQGNLNSIYSSGVNYDQRKNVKLWVPNPGGTGDGRSKTFTFYGLAVPTQIPANGLNFSFVVDYPDPMDPSKMKKHPYTASIGNIHFDAGKCTTISISLNHRSETITIGAEYDDWEFVQTPDQGELKKHSVFLSTSDRSSITIVGDAKATADDATWLYQDSATGKIVDIYGHKGTETDPYVIKNVEQFLSFAYEVNVGNGGGGRDFAGQYINLDAGLTLQPTNDREAAKVVWPGIGKKVTPGVNSSGDRPFNGTLDGGVRIIKRLYGNPLFGYIGPTGHVDQLRVEEVLGIPNGAAAFVTQNDGIICAGKVASFVGDKFELGAPVSLTGIKLDETDNFAQIDWGSPANYENGSTTVAAPFVAYNNGILLACYCTGGVSTTARRSSGIVGFNNGAMVVDYSAVKITESAFSRGTVAYNRYHPDFFINHDKPHPDEIPYQTVKFDKKAARIFDTDGDTEADKAARDTTFTVTGLKNLKNMEGKVPVSYQWGVIDAAGSRQYGQTAGTYVDIISDATNTESIKVRSKHSVRGETFFCVKVGYSDTAEGEVQGYVEDYVRVMAAEPLKEPRRLKGDYKGTLTHCFFDYQVSGISPGLALGDVYGYTTAQMQSSAFIGSTDLSNKEKDNLNGAIHYFADENNAHLIPASLMEGYKVQYGLDDTRVHNALMQLSSHCMARYYVFHVGSYPWVY